MKLHYLCYHNTFVQCDYPQYLCHNTFATIPLSTIPYTGVPGIEGVPHPFRHHIPPDARFQQKNQNVAEASKSREKNRKEFRSKCSKIFSEKKTFWKIFPEKKCSKIHKKEQHKRKISTNFHLQNDCCFGGRSKRWRDMAEIVAEAHFARTTLCASLDPKLSSLRILHLWDTFKACRIGLWNFNFRGGRPGT